jgi:hypothetical protein
MRIGLQDINLKEKVKDFTQYLDDSSNLVKIDGLDIEETVRWCLSEFSTCINTAALWDKQKT